MDDVENVFIHLASGNAEVQAVNSRLQDFIDKFTLVDLTALLHRSMARPERVDDISKYSYEHANGFKKLTLLRSEGFYLRAHLWGTGQAAAENIHGHRWPFASRIISGELREERFQLSTEGATTSTHREYLYETNIAGDRGHFSDVRSVILRRTDEVQHAEGETYAMTPGELHRVIGTRAMQPSVSVIVTGRSVRRGSPVFAKRGRVPQPDRVSRSMSAWQTRELISQLLEVTK